MLNMRRELAKDNPNKIVLRRSPLRDLDYPTSHPNEGTCGVCKLVCEHESYEITEVKNQIIFKNHCDIEYLLTDGTKNDEFVMLSKEKYNICSGCFGGLETEEIKEQCCSCGKKYAHNGIKEWTFGGSCHVYETGISGPGYGTFEDEFFYWMSMDTVPNFPYKTQPLAKEGTMLSCADFICHDCILDLYEADIIDAGEFGDIVDMVQVRNDKKLSDESSAPSNIVASQ